MADSYNSLNGNGSGALNGALEKMMERGFAELDKADQKAEERGNEKTVKLFGLFEMPEMVGTIVQGLWNEASHEGSEWLQVYSVPFYTAIADRLGLKGGAKTHAVATATIGTTTALKSLMYVNPIPEALKKQNDERRTLARRLAPVLDELQGNHSVGALMGVKNNGMIRAHVKRMSMTADTDNANNYATLAINVVPNVITDLPNMKRLWKGNFDAKAGGEGLAEKASGLVERIARMGTSPLANAVTHANTRKLKRKFTSPYTALDMVLELEKQVEENPKASSFQGPGRNGESYTLQEYIEKVMIQQQKDMADIYPDNLELRPALMEDIKAAAKPMAEAIANGDMSAMSLVMLIGTENAVIRNKGRAVASADQVQALIKRDKPKAHKFTTVDSKEFYANATFTKEQLAQALKTVKGEERQILAAMLPDSILEEAGMAKTEINAMRKAMMDRYEHTLAQTISGVVAKSDEQLAKEGLSKHEVKQLREAAEKMASEGEKAVHELKSGPTNAHSGIERAMTNLAVPQLNGDKTYLGTLLETGRTELASISEKAAAASESKASAVSEEKSEDSAAKDEAKDVSEGTSKASSSHDNFDEEETVGHADRLEDRRSAASQAERRV